MADADTNERLERVEASQAYAERAVETLDEEVRLLNQRVADLRRQLTTLEQRLASSLDATGRDDEPPDDTLNA
jgi:uncharacterized coiled-coil protein SlyX